MEQVDCKRVVQLVGEYLISRGQEMSEEKGKRKAAEKRVAELTEGLKETMVLFTEREESFDSLARINKEQERKVRVD